MSGMTLNCGGGAKKTSRDETLAMTACASQDGVQHRLSSEALNTKPCNPSMTSDKRFEVVYIETYFAFNLLMMIIIQLMSASPLADPPPVLEGI